MLLDEDTDTAVTIPSKLPRRSWTLAPPTPVEEKRRAEFSRTAAARAARTPPDPRAAPTPGGVGIDPLALLENLDDLPRWTEHLLTTWRVTDSERANIARRAARIHSAANHIVEFDPDTYRPGRPVRALMGPWAFEGYEAYAAKPPWDREAIATAVVAFTTLCGAHRSPDGAARSFAARAMDGETPRRGLQKWPEDMSTVTFFAAA